MTKVLFIINHRSWNILLKGLVYIQFFNQALAHTLLFLFLFCFAGFLENTYSISNKLNNWFSLEFAYSDNKFLEVSFLHIIYEFHVIKLNVIKHALNCVSWNSLKKYCNSVSFLLHAIPIVSCMEIIVFLCTIQYFSINRNLYAHIYVVISCIQIKGKRIWFTHNNRKKFINIAGHLF